MLRLAAALACLLAVSGAAYAQTDDGMLPADAGPAYEIHIPDMMIRGETYQGLIVAREPATADVTFRFGSAGGDIILPEAAVMRAGTNHALFDMHPIDSTILSGRISTMVTVISPDGIRDIGVETHPGVGTVSRLWIVGPGEGGVVCDGPTDGSAADVAARAAEGVFDAPEPDKEIRTRLSQTAVHIFLADRYCTPVTAPPGGVAFQVSSDTPDISFGASRTHVRGVIPEGFNSAVLDVSVDGSGTIYATGTGVAPDSMRIEGEPVTVELHLGIGPTVAMESSHVWWYLWMERDGERFVPDAPLPVYLTTDNPVLASFDQSLVDSSGPAFADIRPHHEFMVGGSASGIIHTGTPAGVGDVRLLAGDRDVTVYAHVPGVGAAEASFQVGMPGPTGGELVMESDQLQRCITEDTALPDGFYSQACNEMWRRMLVASHFFDIKSAATDAPPSTADETINFLNSLFGGDNTDSGTALFDMVNRLNEYSISEEATGGLAADLTQLLERYLQTSDISVQPTLDLGVAAEMLDRMPANPPPNRLHAEYFPGKPGTVNVVVSAFYDDGSVVFPVYMPDGTITVSSDWGLDHPPEVRTYGSGPRPEAPGTRPSAAEIPVAVVADGTLSASLGGVGSHTIQVERLAPDTGKRLHVATLPGSGERDMIALISVVDSDGLLTSHEGDIYVEAGQGASDVGLAGWRGGGGMVRGSVDGVGEIVIHAPGLGGGTALTTPVRHETGLAVWHPDTVHVSEEFPLVAHALDSDGLPIRRVQVEVAGGVTDAGGGLALRHPGTVPIIIEYGGMFHAAEIDGFMNRADVGVAASSEVVELNDTVVVSVHTGAMDNPQVSVAGGQLLFSGERERWEALANVTGQHTVRVSVSQPGWEPYDTDIPIRVSHLLDIAYDASTADGARADAALTICGHEVPSGISHKMEPAQCRVSVPQSLRIGEVSYHLESLEVDGRAMQSGSVHNFAADSVVRALYAGVVTVEVMASMPDGASVELLWGEYSPGDYVVVNAEPQYQWWGLVWDRPVSWSGLPPGAFTSGTVSEWDVEGNATVTVQYERDLTYLVMAGAAVLSVPAALFMVRKRLPGLRFK